MFISVTKVSYNKIRIVIDAHVYKQWLLIKIKHLCEIEYMNIVVNEQLVIKKYESLRIEQRLKGPVVNRQ